MRIDKLVIKDFKNLRDFSIDFDKDQLTTVLIGQNGTGKSNLFEALVLIFRALDLGDSPPFAYSIRYLCRGRTVEVSAGTPEDKSSYSFKVDEDAIARTAFHRDRDRYLPQHVFAYYSGPSQRLAEHFEKHLEMFYRASKEGKTDQLRRLFLCRGVHSQFVLLVFYAFEDKASRSVLRKHLQLLGLDSVLFVLKKPRWYKKPSGSRRQAKTATQGDERFFGAKGMVQDFLDHTWDHALAPLYHEDPVRDDYRAQPTKEQRLYLFIKDQEALRKLAETFGDPKTFFANLETTDLSDLIREVRIRVRCKGVDGFLTFKELSEGEQQLLAVLGLLKFTKQDEALFLLDEPDTHLNPAWTLNYLNLLADVVGQSDNSQLILASHDPLFIGGLVRQQVRVLTRVNSRIACSEPETDPRGMGFAGLLKSELYGLRSTVDPETLKKLDRRYELHSKGDKRTASETKELQGLASELAKLGFAREFRDPYFEEYVKARAREKKFQEPVLTSAQMRERERLAKELVKEVLAEEQAS